MRAGGAKINVLASFFMPFVNFYIKITQKCIYYSVKLWDFSRNCLKNETTMKILHIPGPGAVAALNNRAQKVAFGKILVKSQNSNNQQKIPYSRLGRAKRLAALHREPLALCKPIYYVNL